MGGVRSSLPLCLTLLLGGGVFPAAKNQKGAGVKEGSASPACALAARGGEARAAKRGANGGGLRSGGWPTRRRPTRGRCLQNGAKQGSNARRRKHVCGSKGRRSRAHARARTALSRFRRQRPNLGCQGAWGGMLSLALSLKRRACKVVARSEAPQRPQRPQQRPARAPAPADRHPPAPPRGRVRRARQKTGAAPRSDAASPASPLPRRSPAARELLALRLKLKVRAELLPKAHELLLHLSTSARVGVVYMVFGGWGGVGVRCIAASVVAVPCCVCGAAAAPRFRCRRAPCSNHATALPSTTAATAKSLHGPSLLHDCSAGRHTAGRPPTTTTTKNAVDNKSKNAQLRTSPTSAWHPATSRAVASSRIRMHTRAMPPAPRLALLPLNWWTTASSSGKSTDGAASSCATRAILGAPSSK